jgi:hypothetical protein
MAKNFHLPIQKRFDIWFGENFYRLKFLWQKGIKMPKFHLCYWVFFSISSFAMIEEMASGNLNSHSFVCKLTEGD